MLLNQRLIVYLGEERGLLFIFGWGGDEMDVGFHIKSLLIGQHPVPDIAAAAEGFFKQLRLSLVWIEAGLDGGELFNIRHIRPPLHPNFRPGEKDCPELRTTPSSHHLIFSTAFNTTYRRYFIKNNSLNKNIFLSGVVHFSVQLFYTCSASVSARKAAS